MSLVFVGSADMRLFVCRLFQQLKFVCSIARQHCGSSSFLEACHAMPCDCAEGLTCMANDPSNPARRSWVNLCGRKQIAVGCNTMDRDSVIKKGFANNDVQDADSHELVNPISMGHYQTPI